jgi:iron(III) transport system substrate-binding protein
MIERIASGKDLIGYNLLGSYAIGRARRDPSLGVVLPRDYTLVVSRVILIAKKAKHPNAAKLWLDFVLSRRGQEVLAQRSRFFSIRPDVVGEFTAATLARTLGASARPIGVGPGLLVFLDKAKHQEFIRRWRQAITVKQGIPRRRRGTRH